MPNRHKHRPKTLVELGGVRIELCRTCPAHRITYLSEWEEGWKLPPKEEVSR